MDQGRKLLSDLKTSKFLPAFNDDIYNEIVQSQSQLLREIVDNNKKAVEQEDERDKIKPLISLKLHQMKRNKRVVLAYFNFRMQKIMDAYWHTSGELTEQHQNVLHAEEQDFANNYIQLIKEYQAAIEYDGDLTKGQTPPTQVFIEVRVVKQIGMIITSDGDELDLQQGTQHFVKRSDVEKFILDGSLIIV